MTSVKIVDFYRILGIQQDASQEQIKRAYHRALLRHHPDKKRVEDAGLTPTTIPAIDTLVEAFKALSSPASRQIYDQILKSSPMSCQPPMTAPRPANVVSLDDFQEVNQGDSSSTWTHPCRCGGTFIISEQLLDEDIHLIGCDCCSEVVWVGYEAEEY
jgi:diphthamide biosynthesis protein 4